MENTLKPESISSGISAARRAIERSSKAIAESLSEISMLQQKCQHRMLFNRQVNAYHDHNWRVTYKCTVCDLEESQVKPPVCEVDGTPLVRVDESDTEAEGVRRATLSEMFQNPPIAFRCPMCLKIHILAILGD